MPITSELSTPTFATRARGSEGNDQRRPVDRLKDVQVDPETGLYIGTITISTQRLRVDIRPLPQTQARTALSTPLLFFNGIGANLELVGPLMSRLANVETVVFDVPGRRQVAASEVSLPSVHHGAAGAQAAR